MGRLKEGLREPWSCFIRGYDVTRKCAALVRRTLRLRAAGVKQRLSTLSRCCVNLMRECLSRE
jgi:hypothetical protein